MFWKYGLFCSILTGSIWGLFWQIIFYYDRNFNNRRKIICQRCTFLIVGSLISVIYVFLQNKISIKFHLLSIIFIVLLIYSFTFGDPFLQKKTNSISTFLLLVINSFFTWISIYLSLKQINVGKLSRYNLEKFYLRLLWGLGLIILIFNNSLPFYIMIMTSLKNQQSLILNH